jgi:beta-glucanase (GH16 family)
MEHWDNQPMYGVYLHTAGPTQETHVPAPDLGAWHTYALSWEPDQLTWYLDGEQVYSTSDYVPHQLMYFVANVAESEQLTATAGCEGTMQIRSVKIWQHS